jgi:hypothetical protein
MVAGEGGAEQVPPIVAAGFTPVKLFNVTAADLAGLHVLFVQNPSTMGYGAEYLASVPAVQTAVNAGLVLIIHDRFVGPGPTMTRLVLPLPAGVPFPLFARVMGNNNTVSDPATLVANGPGGQITDANLDNGQFSNMGSVNLITLNVAGRKGLLHVATTPNSSITFSYPVGLGFVIYSSIPLDVFLKDMGMASPQVRQAFREVYAPNVLAYAACGLRALPATVSTATASGHYGRTVTLTATVKCGVIPLPDVTVDFSLNGVPVGSAQTNASGMATLANASLGSSPADAVSVGTYPTGVAAAFGGTPSYGASSATAALTVEKAPATISHAGGTFVYDGTAHPATGSVTGVFGESLGGPSFTYTDLNGTTSDAAPIQVGVYGITASSSETDSYLATTVSSSATTITITPASLTVTADDKTKTYGNHLPVLTATYQGFVSGDDAGVLTGTLSLTTTATATSPVGTYAIDVAGLAAANYAITFVSGALTVTPAALTVTADDKTKTYGSNLPALTATYQGFVSGDDAGVLTGTLSLTTTATAASPVGSYAIDVAGLAAANYAITFVSGALTVTPAALTVQADDRAKIYGAGLPVFGAIYHGFLLGETADVLGGMLLLVTPANPGSPVGQYPIIPFGLTSPNYVISFVNGTLAVTPATLRVRADDQERLVGSANPALTVTYEGFVAGDTPASLDARPSTRTDAGPASPVGSYPIVVSGAASSNYTIEHVDGTLTVSPEGQMLGAGMVEAAGGTVHFVFGVRDTVKIQERGYIALSFERPDPLAGRWGRPRKDSFISYRLTSVTFSDDPAFKPGPARARRPPQVDSVSFAGTGYWNGMPATFEASASDQGEPGATRDTFSITIRVGGTVVAQVGGVLDSGNVQSSRLSRR